MSYYLYPLPKEYYEKSTGDFWHGAWTYSTHSGAGKLDFPAPKGTPVRSMTDGKVIKTGWYEDHSATCVEIEVTKGYKFVPFVIRYLHLVEDNIQVSVGDIVSQGQLLGYVGQTGSQEHLHVDIKKNGSFMSQCEFQNNEDRSEDYKKGFSLWKDNQGGTPGRCWEIFTTSGTYQTPSQNDSQNSQVDISSRFTSEEDWNALYGMTLIEEGVCLEDLSNINNLAVLEWVIRVFRNRMISGASIEGICNWNTDDPFGKENAIKLGKDAPDFIKNMCNNIIHGKDYFYIEKVATDSRYRNSTYTGSWTNQRFYDKLYSADMFSGGSQRYQQTLARVPFAGGTFNMEGTYSVDTLKEFYSGNADNETNYPSPYKG